MGFEWGTWEGVPGGGGAWRGAEVGWVVGWDRTSYRTSFPGCRHLPCLTLGLDCQTVRFQGRPDFRQPPWPLPKRWQTGDAVMPVCVGAASMGLGPKRGRGWRLGGMGWDGCMPTHHVDGS